MSSSGSIDIVSTVKNILEKLWKYRYALKNTWMKSSGGIDIISTVKNIHEKFWKYRYYIYCKKYL